MTHAQERRSVLTAGQVRDANERMVQRLDTFWGGRWPVLELMCECSFADCDEMIMLSRERYDAKRAAGATGFIVHPAHAVTS